MSFIPSCEALLLLNNYRDLFKTSFEIKYFAYAYAPQSVL